MFCSEQETVIQSVNEDIQDLREVNKNLDKERKAAKLEELLARLEAESVSRWIDAQEQIISLLSREDLIIGTTFIETIVGTELADLGILNAGETQELYAKLFPIIKKIVTDSRNSYPLDLADGGPEMTQESLDEARSKAVKNASTTGIAHAPEVASAVTGVEYDTESVAELVHKTSLQDMMQHVTDVISTVGGVELTLADFDTTRVAEYIKEAIPGSWLEENEPDIVKKICDTRISSLSDTELKALVLAATAVHASWEAIQPRRTVYEQKEMFDAFTVARTQKSSIVEAALPNKERLTNSEEFKDLRIFRSNCATLPAMIVGIYKDTYKAAIKSENELEVADAHNKAIALAIFELLKDLVKIGRSAAQA